MFSWLQNMGKKRRRTPGSVDSQRGGNLASIVASTAVVILVVILVILLMRPQHGSRMAAAAISARPASDQPLLYRYNIEREFAHQFKAFTQGFEYDRSCKTVDGKQQCEDVLWESTGLNGESSIREVSLETGATLRQKLLERADFAEGVTKLGDKLYQLTWQSPKMFIYSAANFEEVQEAATPLSDGWGICTDGKSLIVSDSSATIAWLDPQTLQKQREVTVHDGQDNVPWVNEMEWVDGEIWGNVWQTECIARIDPSDGKVLGWALMHGLRKREMERYPGHRMDVLNGIAWDKKDKRLFVTGKWWHHVYQVKLQPRSDVSLEQARQMCIPSPIGGFG